VDAVRCITGSSSFEAFLCSCLLPLAGLEHGRIIPLSDIFRLHLMLEARQIKLAADHSRLRSPSTAKAIPGNSVPPTDAPGPLTVTFGMHFKISPAAAISFAIRVLHGHSIIIIGDHRLHLPAH
jgi:hypothetical protein